MRQFRCTARSPQGLPPAPQVCTGRTVPIMRGPLPAMPAPTSAEIIPPPGNSLPGSVPAAIWITCTRHGHARLEIGADMHDRRFCRAGRVSMPEIPARAQAAPRWPQDARAGEAILHSRRRGRAPSRQGAGVIRSGCGSPVGPLPTPQGGQRLQDVGLAHGSPVLDYASAEGAHARLHDIGRRAAACRSRKSPGVDVDIPPHDPQVLFKERPAPRVVGHVRGRRRTFATRPRRARAGGWWLP